MSVFRAGWSETGQVKEESQNFIWDNQPMTVYTVGVPFAKEFSGEGRPDLVWFAGMDAVDAAFQRVVDTFVPDVVHYFHFYQQSVRTVAGLCQRNLRTVITLLDYHPFCLWFSPFKVQDLTYCHASDEGRRCQDCFAAIYGAFTPQASFGLDKAAAYILTRRRAMHGLLGSLDALISPSRYLVSRYKAEWPDLAARMRIIHHGLNVAGLKPPAPATGLVRNLGYFGGNAVSKGVHLILKAAGILRGQGYTFHLFGPYDVQNIDLPRDCGIIQHGIVPRTDVWQKMADMDVVLQPSYTENYSTVVREAFFCNRPVIAADNTGLPELVAHEQNGLLFSTGDACDLAAQIQKIATHPGLYATLTANVAAQDNKCLKTEAAEYAALYEELLTAPPRGQAPPVWPEPTLVQTLGMQKMTGQNASELLDSLPRNHYRYFFLGRMAYHAGDWKQARQLLDNFMPHLGQVPEATIRMDAAFKLARLAERAGDISAARHWAAYLADQGAASHHGFARGFGKLRERLKTTSPIKIKKTDYA